VARALVAVGAIRLLLLAANCVVARGMKSLGLITSKLNICTASYLRSKRGKRKAVSCALRLALARMANPLAMKEEDLKLLLAADAHIGTKNVDPNMERYIWKRRADGAWRSS